MAEAWPTEIRLSSDRRTLAVAFDTGERHELSAEYLRVETPSAEARGHAPSQRKTVAGKRDVLIASVEPIGNYAVKINFGDGHETGIYTWGFLAELGRERDRIWGEYLAALEAANLSRDPTR